MIIFLLKKISLSFSLHSSRASVETVSHFWHNFSLSIGTVRIQIIFLSYKFYVKCFFPSGDFRRKSKGQARWQFAIVSPRADEVGGIIYRSMQKRENRRVFSTRLSRIEGPSIVQGPWADPTTTCSTQTIINRSQRTSFAGVTILLSLTVFLNMVAETMPATSDAVPLLGELDQIDFQYD